MTPLEFKSQVLPSVLCALQGKCICSRTGIRNLIKFNFEKYNIAPIALADSEILINELIRSNKEMYKSIIGPDGNFMYTCLNCGCILSEICEEYSINMSRSYIAAEGVEDISKIYMVGFYGFDLAQVQKIDDYLITEDINEFLEFISI